MFAVAKQTPQDKEMLTFVLLMLIIIMATLAQGTLGSAPSNSHSKSHRSHSHSHHSESQSTSQGVCPTSGLLAATPNNATLYHTPLTRPCSTFFAEVNNNYGVASYYPCVQPGGLTLAPTSVTLQLSEQDAYPTITVVLIYNFSYYHKLHPEKVPNCYNEPVPGRHNPPFLWRTQFSTHKIGCDKICSVTNEYIVQCGADYLSAKSGEYYVEIPYVGRFNFNVSVCFKQKFTSDYAAQCFAEMETCPADTAFYTAGAATSRDGVRFAFLWTTTLVMAALLLL
jgi:hypothetical protein